MDNCSYMAYLIHWTGGICEYPFYNKLHMHNSVLLLGPFVTTEWYEENDEETFPESSSQKLTAARPNHSLLTDFFRNNTNFGLIDFIVCHNVMVCGPSS